MTTPLISVAIPAYNHAPFIKDAIYTALGQEGVDLEIVVVDDASTDSTADIAESIAKVESRVRVFRNGKNLGPSGTTREYLKHVRGRYLVPLPSDDSMLPGRLARQLMQLENDPRLAFSATGVRFINESGGEIKTNAHFAAAAFFSEQRDRGGWLRYFFNVGNPICASSILIRTDLFKSFCPDFRLVQLQDYDSWVRLVLEGYDIGMIDEPLTNYRILNRQMNLSAPTKEVRSRNMFEHEKVLDRYHRLTDIESLEAMLPKCELNIPRNVRSDVYVQHQLSLHAWNLGFPQHRNFALNNWYRLLGDESIREDLATLGVDAKFLAGKASMNPLSEAISKTPSGKARRLAERVLPGGIRNAIARNIKVKRSA